MILIIIIWLSPAILKHLRNIPRHRFWRMLKSEKVRRLTAFCHAKKTQCSWKTILSIFFQLLTLVFLQNVDVPHVVFDHEAIPPEVIRWTSRLSPSSPGTKVSEVTLKTVTLERFPLEDRAMLRSVSQKTNQKKSALKVNVKEFYRTKRFVGLPAYRTTKG